MTDNVDPHADEDLPRFETGRRWWNQEFHIAVPCTLEAIQNTGWGSRQGVSDVVLHTEDGYEVEIAAEQDHSLSYNRPQKDSES